jgi:hypothetical protein
MALARPTPYSWSVGDTISVTLLNAIRDALNWSQQPPVFMGYGTTSQSVGNTGWAGLSLGASVVDSYSGHSTTTNPSRYTCQTGAAGWYLGSGVYAPVANSTGFRAARLQVNGSPVIGGAAYLINNSTVEMGAVTPTVPFYLNVGDYVEVAGWQNTGSSLGTSLDVDLRCALGVWFLHA